MTETPPNPWRDLTPDGEGLIVHDFITTRLSTLVGLLKRKLTLPYATQFGLSVSEWRVLSLLEHAGTLPFGELVEQSTSDKSLVSRTIRLLEEKGLLTISPESEHAKKKIACAITSKGQELCEEALHIARRRQAEILCTLPSDERAVLYDAIQKLQKAIMAVP